MTESMHIEPVIYSINLITKSGLNIKVDQSGAFLDFLW